MFKYLLFFNDNDAHFLLFSLVLVYLYRNKRRGRPGIDKEEHNEGEDENNGDDEAEDEIADDKTNAAKGSGEVMWWCVRSAASITNEACGRLHLLNAKLK